MAGRNRGLFRLLGIPIRVDASWLVIFAFLVLVLAQTFPEFMTSYYPQSPRRLSVLESWTMAFVGAGLFFACILLHELGHALAARAHGLAIRGITLFLFGGVAELRQEPTTAACEFSMAIAGPAVSLVLGILFATLGGVGYNGGWPPQPVIILGYLGIINLGLLAFNLLPALPLDGGHLLRAALWAAIGSLHRATHWVAIVGQGLTWLLIACGVWLLFQGAWLWGIAVGLIGVFLYSGGRSAYHHLVVREILRGEPVSRFMNDRPVLVPPGLNLRQWVDDYVYRHHRKLFPVGEADQVKGVISTQALARFPREEWPQHTVAEVMRADVSPLTVPPQEDALHALARMRRTGSSRLLVIDQGRLVGIVSLKDLLHFLHLKLQFEDAEHPTS